MIRAECLLGDFERLLRHDHALVILPLLTERPGLVVQTFPFRALPASGNPRRPVPAEAATRLSGACSRGLLCETLP